MVDAASKTKGDDGRGEAPVGGEGSKIRTELGGVAEAKRRWRTRRAATRESGGLTISGEGCRWRLIDATAAPSAASRRSATERRRRTTSTAGIFSPPPPPPPSPPPPSPFPLSCIPPPCLASLPLPSCSRSLFRLPRFSLLLHRPSLHLFSIPLNARRLRTSRCSRFPVPSLILRAVSPRFPPARPPPSPTTPPANSPPNPPGSPSHPPLCTTRVLTVRRTSAHRGTPCNPPRAREDSLRPPSQEGCSDIALSGCLAGSVLAWRPLGAQVIREPSIIEPETTRSS
jgi:hypothetical protein